ncbi:M48 family metalloprotease [Hyalangium rubrum]|uniref:M48 family metalloprotease n=1 Tax=Hyalangium rubrum TaxID=3103134 RepID=A0ABU5HG61_9BACT|nr:M48 family metalloprotease [Hyalangium sp. s54d21]MDY7232463.1 M48 family metalloprotease [Hyalangium sp. s54d21]
MSLARFTPEQVDRCWKEALALWDVRVQLTPPEPHAASFGKEAPENEPLAYIDLVKRQVFVNFELLSRMGAEESLMAVLAHEIGHHVRFPHTLGWDAELRALEQRLIPGLKQSLTNLFFDLQVNEVVGRTHAEALCEVYRGFLRVRPDVPVSPLFFFYLSLYEELWIRPPGDLVPSGQIGPMEEAFPGCRAEARMFVQTFYALPDMRQQFLYFCATFIRFIDQPDGLEFCIPLAGDVPLPDEDDLDAAAHGGDRWDDALKDAKERGWLAESHDTKDLDPLATIARVTEHRPGKGGGVLRRALVSRHYRRLVDQYVLKLPSAPSRPEPYLRTTPEAWEYGDDPSTIDWTLTVLSQGPLAAVAPLRRELEADVPPPSELGVPAVEIYLDTSGSMPNPQNQLNAMTLAAQVLSATAIRKRATVRAIVYSDGAPLVSPWMYDEETARDFLLHYIGGGTMFPFERLTELSRERPDALRIIISDSDFLSNVADVPSLHRLVEAVRRSRAVVAFLAVPDEQRTRKALKLALADRRFRLVTVQWMSEFGPAAAALSQALLED